LTLVHKASSSVARPAAQRKPRSTGAAAAIAAPGKAAAGKRATPDQPDRRAAANKGEPLRAAGRSGQSAAAMAAPAQTQKRSAAKKAGRRRQASGKATPSRSAAKSTARRTYA
jgi:hypothetical protein